MQSIKKLEILKMKFNININQTLEALISVYDKNIALNIKNLLYVLENYKKEDVASKFEII